MKLAGQRTSGRILVMNHGHTAHPRIGRSPDDKYTAVRPQEGRYGGHRSGGLIPPPPPLPLSSRASKHQLISSVSFFPTSTTSE